METFEQGVARRRQESGARFWFGDQVSVLPLDPTEGIWDGTVEDVIRCSQFTDGFNGFMYIIRDNKTGRERYCREETITFLNQSLSQDKERYAAYEAVSRSSYPQYYNTPGSQLEEGRLS